MDDSWEWDQERLRRIFRTPMRELTDDDVNYMNTFHDLSSEEEFAEMVGDDE